MILLLKVKQMLQYVFIMRLKYFHNSLNIGGILAAGREFFSAKYVQFPLTFTE